MACFLAASACRGTRPKSINLKGKYSREQLISKLMSQRGVLRFLNAPDGFGKSTLAAQYADLVFSFKDTFWVNCKSPCFIRDLDSEDIFNQIIQLNNNPKLVIFDSLEILNSDRQKKVSDLIDNLLNFNCEVLCTSSNYNDSILKWQPDSLVLSSQDLLLSHTELDIACEHKKLDFNNVISRIPMVAWCENGIVKLLECAVRESLTDALIFSLFYIYLFGSGSLDEFSSYIPKSSLKLLKEFNEQYIYFGINEETETFDVLDISIKTLLTIFSNYKNIIFKYLDISDKNEFVDLIFDKFIKKRLYKKAIELVKEQGNKNKKIECLEKFNEDCIKNMYMAETSELYESIIINKKDSGLNSAFHALRLAILGFTTDAIKLSYSILDNNNSYIDNKLFAALIFMRFGQTEEKNQAIKIIRFLNNDFKIESYLKNNDLKDEEKRKCRIIQKVSNIYLAIYSETINPFESWLSSVDDEISTEDIISAECIFNSVSVILNKHIKSKSFIKFISKFSRHFNYGAKSEFDFFTFALIKSYLKNKMNMEDYAGLISWEISNNLMQNLDEFDRLLNIDKNRFISVHKSYKSTDNFNLRDFQNSNQIITDYKNILATKSILYDNLPKLFIKVFGGLTAIINDQEILETNFGRKNIKCICCILTIENGQEISKEKISSLIWPESDSEQRRVNMNTHWSVFKKILTLPNGLCPYLVRNQNSYKLNNNFVDSDIQILETLCSDLTMGPLDSQSWFERMSKYQNILNGDLLPSETGNTYINNKRIEYKNMLVNALLAAAERLLEAGEIQQALWFANKALARDSQREDAYYIMMKAQVMAGQRTPAIETYMACKNFLESDLGLKPSLSIRKMYDKVRSDMPV